jgi:hypothetical protein
MMFIFVIYSIVLIIIIAIKYTYLLTFTIPINIKKAVILFIILLEKFFSHMFIIFIQILKIYLNLLSN